MNVEPAPALAPASAPSFTDNGGSASSSSTSTTSFLLRALLVVLLLGLIGFNVFSYFDEIVAWLSQTFGAPFRAVARFLGYAAADTAKTTVDVTAQGTKSAVDIAAGAATSGINVLQQTIESQGTQGTQGTPASQGSQGSQDDSLERALSHAKKQPPQPDDATSRTQRTRKAGYCYIGEDRGFRSCIRVGEQDTCMSGDIFPTQAVCINPRLRQ
jgi:hypothetical protein